MFWNNLWWKSNPVPTKPPSTADVISHLLAKAKENYNVKLVPVTLLDTAADWTWYHSVTKLYTFNQTEYDGLIYLDSDAVLYKVRPRVFESHCTQVDD